ncbi:MAG: DVU0298 family protein [Thermodesulfobacteriota bacterium]
MKGQSLPIKPWCVFCGQRIGRPVDPEHRKLGEFKVGRCGCGAVYACDVTGHNVGAAMIEALVYACNDDWDLAWNLMPEDDYLTGRLEQYDENSHQIIDSGNMDGRSIRGVLYFVRLHRDIAEVSEKAGKPAPGTVAASAGSGNATEHQLEPLRDPKRQRRRADKDEVERCVRQGDIDTLVDLVFDDKRTLRFLQRLLYTPEEAFRWQVAAAIGRTCGRYATRHPGPVSDLLHRLFVAASDSASSSWGSIETIGEVIAGRPDIFGAFTRHLLNYLNDPSTQSLVLWSLGTIAQVRPDLIRALPFYNLFRYLDHPDPMIRGLCLRLAGAIRAGEFSRRIEPLTADTAPLTIYEHGKPVATSVGELARGALASINNEETSK